MIDYIGSLSSLGYSGDTSDTSEPDGWWDETALVDIDFLNDRAWTAADGEVAISTLMGSDDTAGAWTATDYDPADLNEDGYQSPTNESVAFIGTAKTALLSGSTVVFELMDVEVSGLAGSSADILLMSTPDGSNALEFLWEEDESGLRCISWVGVLNDSGGTSVPGGINCVALTVTPTRVEGSMNGELITEATIGEVDWPTGDPTFTMALMQIPGSLTGGVRMRRIKIKAPLPDATGLSALSARPSGGGGGGGEEPYIAQSVRFSLAYLRRVSAITAANDSKGFVSTYLYIDTSDIQAALIYGNTEGTVLIQGKSNGEVHIELADVDYNNYIYLDASAGALPLDQWFHFILAWDMGHDLGSRRIALYADRAPVELAVDDEWGGAFDVGVSLSSPTTLMNSAGDEGVNQWADYGLWVGSTVVQADGTILAADLNKFVDADGKPVDPDNWPASPVLKFSGDASGFPTNQGSGGAFVLQGTPTNATTSPSD